MTVFGHDGGRLIARKKMFTADCPAEASQRLLEACHCGDLKSASEFLADPSVDVNFVGSVCLRSRKAELFLREECASVVRVEYEEFKTDVTPLFLAVHAGNVTLVRKLLNIGADVNQKLFRGFPITAAVREGHFEIFKILLKAGSSQPACEEALLEASCHGHAQLAKLLMDSDLVRPHVSVHAIFTASCRGFLDVVDTLIKCGVDVDATDRVLLRSFKPSLHTNVDCTALAAAVVSRQASIVRMLLQAGAGTDVKVRLGAWSWDKASGEEFRVGAGLAKAYAITWCAVEYFDGSGDILRMLLQHHSPDTLHRGRTLLHHAILCGNAGAVRVLLSGGANVEYPVKTPQKIEFRPIHMAARLGFPSVLQCLIDFGCDLNSKADSGDTALIICAKHKQEDCLRVLAAAGADFGLVNVEAQSVSSIATSNGWSISFQKAVLHVMKAGKAPRSSNVSIFSPLMLVARAGISEALRPLIGRPEICLDYQDEDGFSALMVAAQEGHAEVFRSLIYAGADMKLRNKSGDTAITLSTLHSNHHMFEKVMLQFALERGNVSAGAFYPLHCAARHGNWEAIGLLMSRGYEVNIPDEDGYTPLMLAAREGHGGICKLLISYGASCDIKTARGETPLLLARKNGCTAKNNEAENVIQNELARRLVLGGAYVLKHTKGGKGAPHGKEMRMVSGVLHWGRSRRQNVACREVAVGPSVRFRKNRGKKGDADEPGVFRVVTTKNREVHFVSQGGVEGAELWVRGIMVLTREALFGKKPRKTREL